MTVWYTAALFLYAPLFEHHSVKVLWQGLQDFPSFYLAARATFESVSPYDLDALQRLAVQNGLTQRVFPFLYPPPSLVLFLPFGVLQYRDAALAFTLLSHAALLLSVWLLCRRLVGNGPSSSFASWFGLAYCFTAVPIAITLDAGQTNLFVLACTTAAWVAIRGGRESLAGALLAVACLFKLYLVLVLGALLLCGLVRVIRASAVTLAGISALAAVALPGWVWGEWLFDVAPSGGYGRVPRGLDSLDQPANQSLAGLLSRALSHGPPNRCVVACYVAAGAILSISALAVLRRKRLGAAPVDDALPLSLLAVYLVAPFSWNHHLAQLCAVSFLAVSTVLIRDPGFGITTRVAVVLAAFAVAWDIPLDGAPWLRLASLKCLAVAVLWSYFALRLVRPQQRASHLRRVEARVTLAETRRSA